MPPDLTKAALTNEPAEAYASVLAAGTVDRARASIAFSWASSETNPGPNTAGIDPSLAGATIPIAGIQIPVDDVVEFGQAGAIRSRSTAVTPYDTHAISGAVGADGAISLDDEDGGFTSATVNLLALFDRVGVSGVTDLLVDQADLRLGIGGAEVETVGGVFQDPDGVGGIGRYRVAQADLDVRSPVIARGAASLFDGIGVIDQRAEEAVNQVLDGSGIELPDGMSFSAHVTSQMQESVFAAILAQPITTKNKILTVDFSTGTFTIHLDQVLHNRNRPGDNLGLNAQHPNTELIDDELYPMIAESVHDLMEEVWTIAVGAIDRSVSAITVDFAATQGGATATWSANLGADEMSPVVCEPQGTSCDQLAAAVERIRPAVRASLFRARDFLIGDSGHELFKLAITDIKTSGITIPARRALEPFIELAAQVFSVQLNHQRLGTCSTPEGAEGVDAVEVSAVSVAVFRSTGVAVLNLGNAGARSDTCAPTAESSIIESFAMGDDVAGTGYSWANPGTRPGPNRAGLNATLLGDSVIDLGGVQVPLSDVVDYGQAGGLLSESTATTPYDGRAVSGMLGSDGAIHLDRADGGFAPLSVDLLSLFDKAGIDTTTDQLVDEAELRLGIGGAEVEAVDGTFTDPDGVGGPGRYRVGQADLALHSPAVEDASAGLYSALDLLDVTIEREVNRVLDLSALTAALPTGTALTADVESSTRDELFAAILARPITTKNKILTVDFSTGSVVIHLDEVLHNRNRPGDNMGLNRQHPNTELVDDELYPMIAESVHDLMEEVTTIALGGIDNALDKITVHFTARTQPNATNWARATWSVNLGGRVVSSPTCTSEGSAGALLCTTLRLVAATTLPVVQLVLIPVRELVVGDAGAAVFRLAIVDIKTNGITIPIRRALAPFLDVVAQHFSVQLNHQRTGTCNTPNGPRLGALRVSAVSVAVLRSRDAARIDFGNAAVRTPC